MQAAHWILLAVNLGPFTPETNEELPMAIFAYMMLFITVAAFGGFAFVHWRNATDRDRIASQLALHGWTLTSIRPAWSLFQQRQGRRYNVTYQAADGAEVQTRCETSMLIGVRWLDAPPPEPKR